MPVLLEAFFALAILGSFVLCYFSARTWRIYNIVLLELVLLAALTFTYMAARTLKTQQSWREADKAWRLEVEKFEQQNHDLALGKLSSTRDEPNKVLEEGILQLKTELEQLTGDRGYMWEKAAPEKINPESGVCQLTIESPSPHEINVKSVLFVFEEIFAENGGRYLGEFRVTKAPAKSTSIEIEPNLPLTDSQRARLKASRGTWSLYALMPVDNAQLFADMDEAERKKLLPKGSQKEFADAKRTLYDYEYLFHQNALECELLLDAMSKTQADLERTDAAEKKAQDEIKYRKSEKADLTADLEKFRYERQVITKYAASLQDKLKSLRAELATALAATARDAAQIKQWQLQEANEIDRRSADQASSDRQPAGANP